MTENTYDLGAIHLWCPHGGGVGVRVRWTHVDGWGVGGSAPFGCPQKKLCATDSSCLLLMQRNRRILYQNFVFWGNEKWKHFRNINYHTKLVTENP